MFVASIMAFGTLSMSACDLINGSGSGGNEMKQLEVFGASCMYKYKQDKVFADAEKMAEIKMNAAANEDEPAQIISAANDEEVSSYEIEVVDLVSESGAKIEKKNIEVYSAYYNRIALSTVGYPSGWYPDILIRMKDRVDYGDNQIAKNENQSIWFNVYVPKGTVAGEYKGEFLLTINNKEYKMPVNMNVYNFELPDETHVQSAFDIWGPSHGNDMLTSVYGSRARAAEETLYEFMLKYRVSADQLPGVNKNDPEVWIEQAVEYAARADVSTFGIPIKNTSHNTYPHWFDETKLHDTLSLLVDRSTEEMNIFNKVWIYAPDEADYTGHTDFVRDFTAAIKNIINVVLEEKDAEGAFEGKPSVREGLKNLPVVTTITDWGNYSTEWCSDSTMCPKYNAFDNEDYVTQIQALQAEGKSVWVYSCGSFYPYTSYTVDADLENQRSAGVFQMRYNIQANLFWCVNLSKVWDGHSYSSSWDPYKTAYAFDKSPGDGYLVAPCGKYNARSLTPYPTMRLEMVREGQEDYEYLYLLKSLVALKGEEAMTALETALEAEYNKLFVGAKPVENPKAFIEFKEKIANMILENL